MVNVWYNQNKTKYLAIKCANIILAWRRREKREVNIAMKGILLLSHGTLCQGMISALEVLGFAAEQVKAVPLFVDSELGAYTRSVSDAIDELDTGEGVLVIADLLGGTPFNRVCELLSTKHIALIVGMSMPMCVTALDLRDSETLESLAEQCVQEGRSGALNALSLLEE